MCAQRVMDEYAGAARPGSKGGRSMDGSLDGHSDVAGSSASLWDSPEHVQLTINLLSSTLAGAQLLMHPSVGSYGWQSRTSDVTSHMALRPHACAVLAFLCPAEMLYVSDRTEKHALH